MKKPNGKVYVVHGEWHPQVNKTGWSQNALERMYDFSSGEANCGQPFHMLLQLESYYEHEDRRIHKMIRAECPSIWNYKEWFQTTSAEIIGVVKRYAKRRAEVEGLDGTVLVNPFNDPYYDPITKEPTIPGCVPMSRLPRDWRRGEKLTLKEKGIYVGEELDWLYDKSIKCTVAGENSVEYMGKIYPSLSNLSCILLKRPIGTVSGFSLWKYRGTLVKAVFKGIVDIKL
jgi:hypothetical protein